MAKKRKKRSNKSKKVSRIIFKIVLSVVGIVVGLTLGLNVKVLGEVFNVNTKYINVLNSTLKEKVENTVKNTNEKEKLFIAKKKI